jgi:restriction system protein
VAAVRAETAASRAAEKAFSDAERARDAAARASAAEQKAAEREAARLYVEAQLARVAERNAELALQLEEIDGLLASTLEVDDFVDLESLKAPVGNHRSFDAGALSVPTPALPPLRYPPEPVFQEPEAPSGLSGTLGGKRRHAEAVAKARMDHQYVVRRWQRDCQDMYDAYVVEQQRLQGVEADRLRQLAQAEAAYQEECQRRDAEAQDRNTQLSRLINDLAFDVPEAIDQYVEIVLSNSVYPETFPAAFEHEFDLSNRELRVTATVPEPDAIPSIKEYRYVKAKDEITASELPVKVQKDRYAGAVWQVALRTLHEVFEADRAGKIASISLTVGTDRLSPSTGLLETIPLVQVATDRVTFTRFNLTNVIPASTLEHMGAAMSKSPFDLISADVGPGVGVRRPM